MKLGKKQRFLRDHPICCFCGGATPSVTTDHVPNRACFQGRAYPEGFEFPACGRCQVRSRPDEQAFAFLCNLSDRNPDNYDGDQSRRLIHGIRNNQPHLFPRLPESANERRRGLRQLGQALPPGMSLSEVPMVSLSTDYEPIIRRIGAKIGLALYYRHKGIPALETMGITCNWAQAVNMKMMAIFAEVAKDLQFREEGWRPNLDFGDRFSYIWNIEDSSNDPDIFAAIVQFGQGMVVCILMTDISKFSDDGELEHWVTVKDLSTQPDAFNSVVD